MYEFLAVLSGLLVGVVVWQVHRARMRAAAVIAMSLAIGVLVTTISGEIMDHWGYALLAAAQVAAAAVITLAVLTRVRLHPAP